MAVEAPARRTRIGTTRSRRVVDLVVTLALSDLKVRYGRGPLRMVKWFLDPFAALGVYLLLVAFVLDRPERAVGLSIACAVIPFQLVMMTVINALDAVKVRGSIITNMAFPRVWIPVASSLTETIAFATSLFMLAALMGLYGVSPTPAVAWFPVVVALTLLLSVAMAYPAALIGLWFPDMRNFIVSFVRTLFFLSAGMTSLDRIYGHTHDLVQVNPLTEVFEAYRDVLLNGQSPSAWELLYPLGWALVLFALFLPLYRREEREFAKVLQL